MTSGRVFGKRGCVIAAFVTSLSSGTAPAADVSADAWCGGVRHLWAHTVRHRLAERGAFRSLLFPYGQNRPHVKGERVSFCYGQNRTHVKGERVSFCCGQNKTCVKGEMDKAKRVLKGNWTKQNPC